MRTEEFLEYFWGDEYAENISNDDKVEIFLNALTGSFDITKELLEKLLNNYNVDTLKIINI